jgi:hypothetical protein
MKLDTIETLSNGIVQVKFNDNEKIVRTTFYPGQNVLSQQDQIKNYCLAAWTPEVVAAYLVQT